MSTSRRPGPSTRVRVHEVTTGQDGAVRRHEDRLATEEPLEIRLAWPGRPAQRVAVTMRTPGHDFELATGFLLAEGVLASAEDLRTVAYCTDVTLTPEQEFNVVTVELGRPPRRPRPSGTPASRRASSACGVCGTESIDDVLAMCDVRASAPLGRPAGALRGAAGACPDRLREAAAGLRLHRRAARRRAVRRARHRRSVVREDIGRHNAVDKVVGARVLAGPRPPPRCCA